MPKVEETLYFQGFSGHRPTDDVWWDLWIILWSADFCCGEYLSSVDAQRELERLEKVAPDTAFRIEHIPNAGFGNTRHVGGWRYFSSKTWYEGIKNA